MDEANAVVQCKECPWYKSCVMPMRLSAEDIKRQMSGTPLMSQDDAMTRYFAEMAAATQNLVLEGCPIFIQRLRANPKLAERIKRLMQTWGTEDDENI